MGGTFVNLKLWIQLSEILRYMSCFIIGEFILPPLFSFLPPRFTFLPSLFFLSPLLLSLAPSLLSPGLPIHCPSSHNRRTNRTKTKQYTSTFRNFVPNLPVSAILVLPVFSRIFQYLQYWYNQYFLESSSICNTGITSIFQNLPVSAILIFWQWLVSSSIADTGKFWEILGY